MSNIRSVAVTGDVREPFVFGCVGVSGTDVARLKRFEVLEGAEFISHFGSLREVYERFGLVWVCGGDRKKRGFGGRRVSRLVNWRRR